MVAAACSSSRAWNPLGRAEKTPGQPRTVTSARSSGACSFLACLLAALSGCGGGNAARPNAETDGQARETIETTTKADQTTSPRQARRHRATPRFARRPVVVPWRSAAAPTGYQIYIRLTRRLDESERIVVRLEGVSDYDLNGNGYDEFVRPACYSLDNTNRDDWPPKLRRPSAGERVRVAVRIRGVREILRARVPLHRARPDDPAPGAGSPSWYRWLRCRPH